MRRAKRLAKLVVCLPFWAVAETVTDPWFPVGVLVAGIHYVLTHK